MLREDKSARIKKVFLGWELSSRHVEYSGAAFLASGDYESLRLRQSVTPVNLGRISSTGQLWWYRDRFYWDDEGHTDEDVEALILHRERRKQSTLDRARAELRDERHPGGRKQSRESIPESVRHEVWRRADGRCVDCGSRERLEFDHIIPVSKGGSNTARNLELRCESCNRKKGATI
jgi:HNH endonuclease